MMMNAPARMTKYAWLPLTPQGVAAFASATSNRLMLVQFIFALAGAATAGWFVSSAWMPTIRDAIKVLPAGAQISQGALTWPGESPAVLAQGRFIGFVVDLEPRGGATLSSDIIVEFGTNHWQVSSLLGALHLPDGLETAYPQGYTIALNRDDVGPWWDAREPFIIAIAMGLGALFLLLSWGVLATLYSPLVWLLAFFGNRAANLRGSWRLAGAALMPGALFVSASIVFYGLGAFDLLRLGLAFGMHFVIGWFYLVASTLCLPRQPGIPPIGANPFDSKPSP